jgi:hypothetical protein
MKVEGILNHVISHNMNHVWIPCDYYFFKSSQKMSFSNKNVINVWLIKILTKNHIYIKDDEHS